MNNQSLMMVKKPAAAGVDEYVDLSAMEQAQDFSNFQSDGAMLVRRDDVAPVVAPQAAMLEKPVPQAQAAAPPKAQPAAQPKAGAAQSKIDAVKGTAAKAVASATDAVGQARAQAAQAKAQPQAQAGQKQAAAQKPVAPAKAPVKPVARPIRHADSPDGLCQVYMQAFKDTLGLSLSPAIVFDNMRRICEADVKDPQKTLFFLENTYRVSTILYLSANLPILVVTSILAEKNRKNILKYVSTEVENGAKPYDELLALRVRRWSRKYENMAVNDAMTVTPGATKLSPALAAQCKARLDRMSAQLKPFNNDLTQMVAKFDDATRNDVTFIYSNWWYLLQGFENVPEMRTYVMAITDDTRKNLKL